MTPVAVFPAEDHLHAAPVCCIYACSSGARHHPIYMREASDPDGVCSNRRCAGAALAPSSLQCIRSQGGPQHHVWLLNCVATALLRE